MFRRRSLLYVKKGDKWCHVIGLSLSQNVSVSQVHFVSALLQIFSLHIYAFILCLASARPMGNVETTLFQTER